ncbi:glycerophosphodiester phosphodiesterase family protein [Larsenimonas suaedae]|uniref:Glycerophosphodiester phosphodiesterase family protein n=1 Tax=Larsenimonas suaedae TaxID=1851019 RepID=A0ABU1GUG0_9GAMM|nr:glycerophosphodiester phosphodiesterase family protein [Larsenimonas suaedae]MCM2970948.1 glycerophosphoryl diester phosphodiesterase [Larsenimonas suaedae]MDR5895657.1 glycerophosphodiester phosphodiesterase family protein [Larsenimonas suaedae]
MLAKFIAHRGLSAQAPENTRAALHAAADAGIKWVELDVQCLGDGTPVIWHDSHVRRCSDGQGLLSELTLDQAKALDVGAWFDPRFEGERMATLDEALDTLNERGLGLNLELKIGQQEDPVGLVERVLSTVREKVPEERLLLSSFSMDALDHIRKLDDTAPIGILFDEKIPRNWHWDAERLSPVSINVDWRYMSEERVREIREAGYHLLCFTVNQPEEFEPWWDFGITGVISDNPLSFPEFDSAR